MSEDIVLVPEIYARHALRERRLSLEVLAPYGSWLGHGTLRVLRMRVKEDRSVELTVGYERYEPLPYEPKPA